MALKYPDSLQDTDGILRYNAETRGMNRTFWDAVEMQSWKSILFFLGLQWLAPMLSIRFWRPLGFKKDQPRPVTNRVKPLTNDLASKLVGFEPPITWSPGSDQEADYVAASVADRVNKAIGKEADIRSLKPIAARWLALTGNVFVVSSYDNSMETGTTFIQAHRCLHCGQVSMPAEIEQANGACPQCLSQETMMVPDPETGMVAPLSNTMPRFENAIDPKGTPIGVQYPRGRHLFELENVFTTRFDPQTDRFNKTPFLNIRRSRDRSWVAERYGDKFAEKVSYARASDPFSVLFDSLALTSLGGGYSSLGGSQTATVTTGDSQRTLVERLWIRPHPTKAPGGIYAEIIGEKLAPLGPNGEEAAIPYPYHDERGMPMLNVAHLEFDQVPGRALAATRMDDVLPLQEGLNELDAFLILHHRRMANAVWTIPSGSDPTRITGEGGIYIRYNPLATGHEPKRVPGASPPADIYTYREIRKREMDEVFGSYEVSRGEAPRGVSAYSAMQLLDERAQQGQSNVFANWALGWMEVSRQGLNIWREWADEDRSLSLGMGRWAVKKFSRAQMIGGVDISVEIGQGRPMTMVAKMARIGQAIQEGVLNVFDPQVRFLTLRAMGIPELMPDYNRHYVRAARIVDQIVEAPTTEALPGPPLPFDNHAVHLEVLQNLILDELFETLPPWKQQALILRAQIHYLAMREDMLSQQARAGQNAPRIGGKNGKGGGGGGGDGYNTEEGVLDQERQDASPDVSTGVSAGNR